MYHVQRNRRCYPASWYRSTKLNKLTNKNWFPWTKQTVTEWRKDDKDLPFLPLWPQKLWVASCPKQDDTSVRHRVGNFWRAGLRFSSVHWKELQLLFTLPLVRQFCIGKGANINEATAAINHPASAISSTVEMISLASKTGRLLSETTSRTRSARALKNDASYSCPLTLEKSNHFAHWQSPWEEAY